MIIFALLAAIVPKARFTETKRKEGGEGETEICMTQCTKRDYSWGKTTQGSLRLLVNSPYSPDLAPCDFVLFSILKSALKWHRFVYFNMILISLLMKNIAIIFIDKWAYVLFYYEPVLMPKIKTKMTCALFLTKNINLFVPGI